MRERYVIECRNEQGHLDFKGPQPESVFGLVAITGITDDDMAKKIFHRKPDAVLTGERVRSWPALLDPRWSARPKTW